MGAHITKNISSDRICGRIYKTLIPIGISLNSGNVYKHEKYYINTISYTPETIDSRTLEPDAYDITIHVENIYYGINIPDVGKFQTITGTLMVNFITQDGEGHIKIYNGVVLNSLFLPYPYFPRDSKECYTPNPKYLLEADNYRIHDSLPECFRLKGEIDNKTIPIVRRSKEDTLRIFQSVLAYLEIAAKKLPDNEVELERISFLKLYELFTKEDDSEKTVWLINQSLHAIYCKLAGSECNLDNIAYEA
jgi:hypothetical protein